MRLSSNTSGPSRIAHPSHSTIQRLSESNVCRRIDAQAVGVLRNVKKAEPQQILTAEKDSIAVNLVPRNHVDGASGRTYYRCQSTKNLRRRLSLLLETFFLRVFREGGATSTLERRLYGLSGRFRTGGPPIVKDDLVQLILPCDETLSLEYALAY